MSKFKSLRGTYDILSPEIEVWLDIESKIKKIMDRFGYSQIRIPTIENAEVFTRSIGQATDIVNKEMYTLEDPSGDISLRPEATAGVVRAYVENSLHKKEKLSKFYYMGSMFRKERPQSGRNREFRQFGIEALGSSSPYLDVEVISILKILFDEIDLDKYVLKINTLGCKKDKPHIAATLKKKLDPCKDKLCQNCNLRLDKNVFRVLDCKNKICKDICRNLELIQDLVCSDCKVHFTEFQEALSTLGIDYVCDNTIVRGLDYYTGPVFEVTHPDLGSQDAIAAGGRYDNLVQDMGGPNTQAVGFALGMERLLLALDKSPVSDIKKSKADIFLVTTCKEAYKVAFGLLYSLRENGIRSDIDYNASSIKSQMRQADRLGVRFVMLLGEEELSNKKVSIKDMQSSKQFQVDIDNFIDTVKEIIK